jgi:hypothetical protein
MNRSHLSYLSSLTTTIRQIQQGDLDVLGSLHALRHLYLRVGHDDLGGFVVGAGSFACLTYCEFNGFVRPIVFQQGAMPRLRTLHSRYFVRGATEIARRHGVGLDFGLGLLPSLQDIYVSLDPMGASKEDEKELKAALRRSSKIHPNHPDLLINGFSQKPRCCLLEFCPNCFWSLSLSCEINLFFFSLNFRLKNDVLDKRHLAVQISVRLISSDSV